MKKKAQISYDLWRCWANKYGDSKDKQLAADKKVFYKFRNEGDNNWRTMRDKITGKVFEPIYADFSSFSTNCHTQIEKNNRKRDKKVKICEDFGRQDDISIKICHIDPQLAQ